MWHFIDTTIHQHHIHWHFGLTRAWTPSIFRMNIHASKIPDHGSYVDIFLWKVIIHFCPVNKARYCWFPYNWRKYYCYHQNSKYFLLPFINGNHNIGLFSIAPHLVITLPAKSNSNLFAIAWKSDNYCYHINFRERAIKKEAKTDTN